MPTIGDKVIIKRNGRAGVIVQIDGDVVFIRPNDDVSHVTAALVSELESVA